MDLYVLFERYLFSSHPGNSKKNKKNKKNKKKLAVFFLIFLNFLNFGNPQKKTGGKSPF